MQFLFLLVAHLLIAALCRNFTACFSYLSFLLLGLFLLFKGDIIEHNTHAICFRIKEHNAFSSDFAKSAFRHCLHIKFSTGTFVIEILNI